MGDSKRKRQSLTDDLLEHCASIVILGELPDGTKGLVDQGSATLVDTGGRRILLTAAHVVAAWIDCNDRAAGLVGYGTGANNVFLNRWSLLGRDDEFDIATLAVPDAFDPTPLGKRFYEMPWPPQPVSPRTGVTFVGGPGSARDGKHLGLRATVATVTERTQYGRLYMRSEGARNVVDFGGKPRTSFASGGVSGAGIFTRGYRDAWELRAVLSHGGMGTGSSGSPEPDDGRTATFKATELASFLERDGTIKAFVHLVTG